MFNVSSCENNDTLPDNYVIGLSDISFFIIYTYVNAFKRQV